MAHMDDWQLIESYARERSETAFRALVERHALLPQGVAVPERFDNTSITVLHEDAPHGASLINCTRHLLTSLETEEPPR